MRNIYGRLREAEAYLRTIVNGMSNISDRGKYDESLEMSNKIYSPRLAL